MGHREPGGSSLCQEEHLSRLSLFLPFLSLLVMAGTQPALFSYNLTLRGYMDQMAQAVQSQNHEFSKPADILLGRGSRKVCQLDGEPVQNTVRWGKNKLNPTEYGRPEVSEKQAALQHLSSHLPHRPCSWPAALFCSGVGWVCQRPSLHSIWGLEMVIATVPFTAPCYHSIQCGWGSCPPGTCSQ